MIKELEILRVVPSNGPYGLEVQYCWRNYENAEEIVDSC
jgi:hypothetical protein